jgi:pilus assembly protein CpaB
MKHVVKRPGGWGGGHKKIFLGVSKGPPPEPAPAAAPAVADKPRAQLAQAAPRGRPCVGVIAGVQRTQECL